jgi:galactose-1-phosphate uridylyltransferase
VAGFELGSGIYLNSASPEENAKYLKEIKADVSE